LTSLRLTESWRRSCLLLATRRFSASIRKRTWPLGERPARSPQTMRTWQKELGCCTIAVRRRNAPMVQQEGSLDSTQFKRGSWPLSSCASPSGKTPYGHPGYPRVEFDQPHRIAQKTWEFVARGKTNESPARPDVVSPKCSAAPGTRPWNTKGVKISEESEQRSEKCRLSENCARRGHDENCA
jgi:hypothetical protein